MVSSHAQNNTRPLHDPIMRWEVGQIGLLLLRCEARVKGDEGGMNELHIYVRIYMYV